MYCVNNDSITLKTLGYDGKDEEILNLNKNHAAKIGSNEIAKILKKRLINYKDQSGGEMIFINGCNELTLVHKAFLEHIVGLYPDIKFTQIPTITPQNELTDEFRSYKFDKVFVNQLSDKGTFRAVFVLADSSTKSLFFRYEMKAKMPVLKATKAMSMRHVLGLGDFATSEINFNEFGNDMISKIPNERLITKQNIKSGEVLRFRQFNVMSLIRKGEKIQAILNDGSLSIIVEATALENGNLGDIIKVRSSEKREFNAQVISAKRVIIR